MKSRKETPKVASKSSPTSSGNQDSRTAGPTVEEIRLRAYARYAERGRVEGQDLEDWFQAEKELTEIIGQRRSD
jgi:Protein of unknown function (DUF2934)